MLFGRVGIPVGGEDEDEDGDEDENDTGNDQEAGAFQGEDGGATAGGRQTRQPRRRVRIVTAGEDGNEVAQDCLLM